MFELRINKLWKIRQFSDLKNSHLLKTSARSLILFSILQILSITSNAAMIGQLKTTPNPSHQHVIIVGSGNDLGSMFVEAAMGRALKIKESDPSSEVLVFVQLTKDLEKETNILKRAGLRILVSDDANLPMSKIFNQIGNESKIASLTLFTHSAITYGIHLYKGARYSHNDQTWNLLRGKFDENAYIFLSGCNTGFYLAPTLSQNLNVPVAGALTSADFQYLDGNGNFKYSAPTGKVSYPMVNSNKKSFESPVSCTTGACSRMQPFYRSYSGYWGEFKNGGFPGFKFFCGSLPEEHCEKVMAISVLHQLSNKATQRNMNENDFRKALANLMCPQFSDEALIRTCEENLNRININSSSNSYSPFLDKTLKCNLRNCEFSFTCDPRSWINRDVKCELINPNSTTNSFVDEYKHYLKGFRSL